MQGQENSVLHGMMPGFRKMEAARALLLKMRMSALRRLTCGLRPEFRRFIEDTCHLMPDVLSEEQIAQVNRLAWRFRWSIPTLARPARDPDSDERMTA